MWRKGQPKMCVDVCTNGEGGGLKNQHWALYILHGGNVMLTLTHFVPVFSFNTPRNRKGTL